MAGNVNGILAAQAAVIAGIGQLLIEKGLISGPELRGRLRDMQAEPILASGGLAAAEVVRLLVDAIDPQGAQSPTRQ